MIHRLLTQNAFQSFSTDESFDDEILIHRQLTACLGSPHQ